MELNDNTAVCSDLINPQAGEGSVAEIQLYDELIAFAQQPPEEQAVLESSPAHAPEGSADTQECLDMAHPPADSGFLIDDSKHLVEVPGPSGPLSGFNLPQEMVYTGALSRGVCLNCGAESGADDLFCLTCGDFIDEIGSTLPSSATCGECQQPIDAGEIFCPWCGSASVAQR